MVAGSILTSAIICVLCIAFSVGLVIILRVVRDKRHPIYEDDIGDAILIHNDCIRRPLYWGRASSAEALSAVHSLCMLIDSFALAICQQRRVGRVEFRCVSDSSLKVGLEADLVSSDFGVHLLA